MTPTGSFTQEAQWNRRVSMGRQDEAACPRTGIGDADIETLGNLRYAETNDEETGAYCVSES